MKRQKDNISPVTLAGEDLIVPSAHILGLRGWYKKTCQKCDMTKTLQTSRQLDQFFSANSVHQRRLSKLLTGQRAEDYRLLLDLPSPARQLMVTEMFACHRAK